ncbi:unnamed protein product [Phytophthora lilii]|uniref:Unnamed protein product n=1 Tax=Phytophthora lilii TaxID=2077276 RepID=A0A9W6TWF5_9STRA|nr:unnamed protein product [Phytophthora lilii]
MQFALPTTSRVQTTMKFTAFLVAMVAILSVVAAAADKPAVKTPTEALDVVKAAALPDGVTLIGTAEKIDPPASIAAAKEGTPTDKKEQFWGLGGLGLGGWGLGGWGNWGGWGGFGPYRFGFMYGGYPGWAYPLGYWNLFGAGLYGGGCGLGIPFGGLYYC